MHCYDILHTCKLVGIILLIVFSRLTASKSKRSKKVVPRPPDKCPSRCVACDQVNGCTKCRSRTFLYLEQVSRRRQVGICVHDCPEGYYESRETTTNMCRKCEAANCASCFVHNYCTNCQNGFFLHEAKCVETCPPDMAANNETKKCDEKVDCVVGSWSSWSECARRSPSRSCKYGRKKRSRVVVQEPTKNGKQCSKLKESRKCKTPANKCPLINVWYQRQLNKMERRKTRNKDKKGRKRKNKKSKIRSNDSAALRSRPVKPKGRKKKNRKNDPATET